MGSLRGRLIVVASILLVSMTLLLGLVVDQAMLERAKTARDDSQRGLIYGLLGAMDVQDDGSLIVAGLPDPALARPSSGLYAGIRRGSDASVWQSESLVESPVDVPIPLVNVWRRFSSELPETDEAIAGIAYSVRWGEDDDSVFGLWVAESADNLSEGMRALRRALWIGLAFFSVALLLMLLLLLRWGLRPVSRLSSQLRQLEQGGQDAMPDIENHPEELRPLVESLNHLLREQSVRQQRYRDALGDLAHSLKTPLSVLQGMADDGAPDREQIRQQIHRMNDIVQYQLQRAATTGARKLARPIDAVNSVGRLLDAMSGIFAARELIIERQFPVRCDVRMDDGDLTEVTGNLIDNASKWAVSTISVRIGTDGRDFFLAISDDGPGFPDNDLDAVLLRGVREDSRSAGQGIGLSVAADIVGAYGGSLRLATSELGGAEIVARFPVLQAARDAT